MMGIVTLGPWRYSGEVEPDEATMTEREKLIHEIRQLRDEALNAVPDWYDPLGPTAEQEDVIEDCMARMAACKELLAKIDQDAERG
jgi:hypothetical protein